MRIGQSRKQKASVLVAALIFTALLAIILVPLLQFIMQSSRMASSSRAGDQAFYAAEAGVARTLSRIFADGSGAVTGIYHNKYAVTQANAVNPFAVEWMSLNEGIASAAAGQPAVRVRVWQDQPASLGTWKIQAVGRVTNPKPLYRTLEVTVRPGSFARYAFFNTLSLSTMDGAARWLAPGEIFNGPVHSNHDLYVYGSSSDHLVFNSDVTMVGNEILNGSSSYVEYNGLKDTNADYIELPSALTALTNAAASGGLDLPANDPWTAPAGYVDPVPNINNYRFQFNANGTVTVTNVDANTWWNGLSAAQKVGKTPPTPFTVAIANTNGAFVVNNGNVFVSGTVNGRVTLAALANDANTALVPYNSSTRTDGNVIVEGNIIYNTHPMVNGSYDVSDGREFADGAVTDVLGLIGERNFALDGSMPANAIVDAHIMLTGQASPNPNVATWGHNQTLSAAVGQDGAFFVEDGVQRDLSELWTGVPDGEPGTGNETGTWKTGDLYLTGGVVHFLRGQTKNGSGGYDRHYSFDQRLMKNPPPFYPLIPDLEVVKWQDTPSTTPPS